MVHLWKHSVNREKKAYSSYVHKSHSFPFPFPNAENKTQRTALKQAVLQQNPAGSLLSRKVTWNWQIQLLHPFNKQTVSSSSPCTRHQLFAKPLPTNKCKSWEWEGSRGDEFSQLLLRNVSLSACPWAPDTHIYGSQVRWLLPLHLGTMMLTKTYWETTVVTAAECSPFTPCPSPVVTSASATSTLLPFMLAETCTPLNPLAGVCLPKT